MKPILYLVALLVFLPGFSRAASKTFTGPGNFSDATKWNGGTLPVAADDLTISGICTVDNSATTDNVAYCALIIGGTLQWAFGGTNRLNVSNVSASSGATKLLNMANGGTLIMRGTWTSTNLSFTAGAGTIEIRSSLTLPAAYATYNNLTVNGSSNAVGLGVNTAIAGTLAVTSGTFSAGAFSLTVTGTATVNGTLAITSATGAKSFGNLVITGTFNNTAANVPFTVNGNFQNNGTFNGGTGRVTFGGATDNTITGTSTTAFGGGITVNKGSSYATVLDVQSLITMLAGGLTLVNGTFKLSSASTITPFTTEVPSSPFLIPSTTGLWCNGGTIAPSAIGWTFAGLIRVSGGTVTVGNAVFTFLAPQTGSQLIVEGGSLNVADRVSQSGVAWSYTMTGGILTVPTVGSSVADRSPFNMNNTACSFSMSGGTVVIRSSGGSAGQNLGYHNVSTGGTGFTGGTLQIGDASTPTGQTVKIETTVAIHNLLVNSANVTAFVQTNAITAKNVTLTAGTLNANNLNITVGGDWTRQSAAVFTPGTNTVTFNGTADQIINGTAASQTFYNIVVNKSSGTTLTVGGSTTALTVQDFTETSGNFTAPATFTINGNLLVSGGTFTSTPTTINGGATRAIQVNNGGTLKLIGTSTFPTGFGSYTLQPTSTVDYAGGVQTVAAKNYGNLTVSAGAAVRTVTLANSGVIGVFTNFSPSSTNNTYVITGSTVAYNGNLPQTMPSSFTTYTNLTVDNSSGTAYQLTLTNNTTITGTFTMNQGSLDLGMYTLTLGASPASPGTLAYVSGALYHGTFRRNVGTGSLTASKGLFPLGSSSVYNPITLTTTSDVTTGGTISVSYVISNNSTDVTTPYMDNGFNVLRRHNSYYNVSTATVAGGTYAMLISGNGWGVVQNVNHLRVSRTTGAWANAYLAPGADGTHAGTTSNPQVNRTGLSATDLNGKYTLGSVNLNTVLPVQLIAFTAKPADHAVELAWSTASELNNDYFSVEKSTDGISFIEAGRLNGMGNSTVQTNYAATDMEPYPGLSYYRLKQVDFDGQRSYSPIVAVQLDNQQPVVTAGPNPFTDSFNLTLRLERDRTATIVMFDRSGNMLFTRDLVPGQNPHLIDMRRYGDGEFILKVITGSEVLVSKLVKTP